MWRRAAARTAEFIRQRALATWLPMADLVDDILLFPTSHDRQNRVICEAIKQRRPLGFRYRGGFRTVEPFCLGRVHRGPRRNDSLLCYQTGGYAELVEVEGWKLYRAREIEDLSVLHDTFQGDRPGYDPDEIPMFRVYCRCLPVRRWQGTAAQSMAELLHRAEAGAAKSVAPARDAAPASHNDLMHRFRGRHPGAVPDLGDVSELEQEPPENAGPAARPPVQRND